VIGNTRATRGQIAEAAVEQRYGPGVSQVPSRWLHNAQPETPTGLCLGGASLKLFPALFGPIAASRSTPKNTNVKEQDFAIGWLAREMIG
jgi:hypothetical protein